MNQTLEYKCPNCGGKLEFNPGTQQMSCPFCDSEINIEALRQYDQKLQRENIVQSDFKAQQEVLDDESMRVYVCESCGGEIIAEDEAAARHCPYCGNPVIFTGNLSGVLKPDFVIPFKLDKDAAKAQLKQHLKGKPLLPGIFKSENHIDEIKGIYVPFWLHDAQVDGDISFQGTKIRTWSDTHYNYTETSYFDIERSGSVSFEHLPADGSSKIPDDLMESIEPFDFSQAVDFKTAYLSGYLADKYDVTSEQVAPRVEWRMVESLTDALRSTIIGYGGLKMTDRNCRFSDENVKYALYPVYILNTSWRGKKYVFAMNGQTGKFVGNLPVSGGKFAAMLSGLTFGFSALAAATMYFMGLFG